MPDEPDTQKNLPGRHRPRLSELSKETTEEDLWDLEEDSRPNPGPVTTSSEPAPRIPPAKPDLRENRELSGEKPPKPAVVTRHNKESSSSPAAGNNPLDRSSPPRASRPNGPRPGDPKSSTPLPEATIEMPVEATMPEPTPETTKEVPETAAPPFEESPSKPATPVTPASSSAKEGAIGKGDKMGLIAFVVVFLLFGIWWLLGLFSSISTTRLGDDQPDLPAEGQYVTVDVAKTYWREPIREGSNPDVARREAEYIPVLSVTIDGKDTGVLRAIFRNEQGEFVGDSISQNFTHGVFDRTSEATIEFPATDGFVNFGEFNGYRVGDNRWTVELFEGPSANASGNEFKLLFTAPISTNRQ